MFGVIFRIASSAGDGWVVTAASTWIAGSFVAAVVYREKLLLLLALRQLELMKAVLLWGFFTVAWKGERSR